MFTGLIEHVGLVTEVRSESNYSVLTISPVFADGDLTVGDSVNCDGACLTVLNIEPDRFTVEASQETAARTIINSYRKGTRINLERALRSGDRLGGHFVSGHTDTVGTIDYVRPLGRSLQIAVSYDTRFDPLVVEKGSIAVNGISLTVNAERTGWLSVNLIPHSVASTTVADWVGGRKVNLEFDVLGKYVLKMQPGITEKHLTKEKLLGSGW